MTPLSKNKKGKANWQRIRKVMVRIGLIIVLILLFPTYLALQPRLPLGSGPAEFYFVQPDGANLIVGQTFMLELHIRTGKSTINAIGSTITFNPQRLEIVTMTTENSFCSFYPENSFDNIRGEAHIACGTPNPGFRGESIVVALKMRTKTNGNSEIAIDRENALILANDGKGTNLLQSYPSLTVNIIQLP